MSRQDGAAVGRYAPTAGGGSRYAPTGRVGLSPACRAVSADGSDGAVGRVCADEPAGAVGRDAIRDDQVETCWNPQLD